MSMRLRSSDILSDTHRHAAADNSPGHQHRLVISVPINSTFYACLTLAVRKIIHGYNNRV